MANKVKGEVNFRVGAKTYTLKFSSNALIDLEDVLGEDIQSVGGAMQAEGKGKLKVLRAMMWAGLQTHHEGLTTREAGDLMDGLGHALAGQKIAEAFALAFPKSGGGEGGPRPQEAARA